MAPAQQCVHGPLDFLFVGDLAPEAPLQEPVHGLVHGGHQLQGLLPEFPGDGLFLENLPDSRFAVALGHGGADQGGGGLAVIQQL